MRLPLNRYLDTVGNGSGIKNGRTNAATDLKLAPALEESFVVEGLTVIVEDTGALLATGYGALAALGTGIGLFYSRGTAGGEYDYLDGLTIKRHYDWLRLPQALPCVDTSGLGATASNFFVAQVKFPEPLVLTGKYHQSLIVRLPALDLTGLDGHYFIARGTVAGQA